MRLLLTWLGLALVMGCSLAKDEKKPAPEPVKAIKVGDAAPPLVVDAWLNGEAIPSLAPGQVYIVDFWATWCGPCLQAMPELGELAAEYQNQKVVVIPLTTVDQRNSRKRIEEYVQKTGKKYGLRFAVCESDTMERTWFEASGAQGIPTTFIVDAAGKIAFIGHPMDVPDVLPLVIAGTWKGEESYKAILQMQQELEALQEQAEKEPAKIRELYAAFEAKYPQKAKQPNSQFIKALLLLVAKQFDDAKAISEVLLKEAIEKKRTGMLDKLMTIWATPQLNPDKKHIDLSLKALEGLLTLSGPEPSAQLLFNGAEIYHLSGNSAKALEFLDKAIKTETDPEERKQMEEAGEAFKKK